MINSNFLVTGAMARIMTSVSLTRLRMILVLKSVVANGFVALAKLDRFLFASVFVVNALKYAFHVFDRFIFRLDKLKTVDTKASQGRHRVATALIGGVETKTTIILKVVCKAKFSQKIEICPTRDGKSPC